MTFCFNFTTFSRSVITCSGVAKYSHSQLRPHQGLSSTLPMKRRSSSVDVGGKSSLELQNPDAESEHRLNGLISRQSSALDLDRQLNGLYSTQANGHQHPSSHAAAASFSLLSLPTSSQSMTMTKQPPLASSGARNRSLWFMSILSFFVATAGVGLLVAIFRSLVTRQIEPKGCRMSYMRPSYIHFSEFDTEHTRFASKYSLYLYREQGIDGGQVGFLSPYSEGKHIEAHIMRKSCAESRFSLFQAMLGVTNRFDQLPRKLPIISMIISSMTVANSIPVYEVSIFLRLISMRISQHSTARLCLTKLNILMKLSDIYFHSIPSRKEALETRISQILHQSLFLGIQWEELSQGQCWFSQIIKRIRSIRSLQCQHRMHVLR